jgi:molybdopterin synthase catalytic subunit
VITDRPIIVDDRRLVDVEQTFGAVVTFTGIVRDHNEGRPVTGIFYDCYREMAEREIARIVEDVETRLPVKAVEVVHRVGHLSVGDISLLVVVASAHRRESFEACQQIIEQLKQRVPIWKKEHYADNATKWL